MQGGERKLIYFEHQSNDRLCGVHCLNSLLQGPFFDEIQLSEIGQKLDKMEKELIIDDEPLLSNQKNFTNVDETGNYNITVLTEALKIYNCEVSPVKQKETEKLLLNEIDKIEAFIFNSSTHWFCIRKIDHIWYNLNSTNEGPGPQIISDFYFGAFIKGTEEIGFTNFLITNLPPLLSLDDIIYTKLKPHQRLASIEEIKSFVPKKINMGDGDEIELEKAIELSKKEYKKQFGNNNDDDKPEDLHPFDIEVIDNLQPNQDIEYLMQMSMNEYYQQLENNLPPKPMNRNDSIEITLIGIDKEKDIFFREFNSTDKVRDLVNFAKAKIKKKYINIFLQSNDQMLYDENMTLKEAGLKKDEIIYAMND